MNDTWSSEGSELETAPETPRRLDRHEGRGHGDRGAGAPDAEPRRYPWIGLTFLLVGLASAAIGLVWIGTDLDRPGIAEVEAERWWLVAGGGLAVAWSAPWFLLPRGRRRMAIVLAICTAAILVVSAIAIGGLRG